MMSGERERTILNCHSTETMTSEVLSLGQKLESIVRLTFSRALHKEIIDSESMKMDHFR